MLLKSNWHQKKYAWKQAADGMWVLFTCWTKLAHRRRFRQKLIADWAVANVRNHFSYITKTKWPYLSHAMIRCIVSEVLWKHRTPHGSKMVPNRIRQFWIDALAKHFSIQSTHEEASLICVECLLYFVSSHFSCHRFRELEIIIPYLVDSSLKILQMMVSHE